MLIRGGLVMTNWFGKKVWRGIIFGGVVGLGIGGVAGFGLGVYFLPILTAVPGLDAATVRGLADSAERRAPSAGANLCVICPARMCCIGGMAPSC